MSLGLRAESTTEAVAARREAVDRHILVALLGLMTILSYGTTYYLLTVLGPAIVAETGWPLPPVVGGLSLGLMASGLAAPWIGRRIERYGGRAALPAACLAVAGGHVVLGLSHSLWLYGVAWILLGLGMAGTFYEAAFASLGRQYGLRARAMITMLTLYGGFASTICWPISAALVDLLDWRQTCFIYAAAMAVMSVLLRRCFGPPPPAATLVPASRGTVGETAAAQRPPRVAALVALGFLLALSATITTVVSVHLIPLLGARDVASSAAVAMGALIGPSQVGARVIEYAIGRRFHPLWTLVASTVLMVLGLGLLALGWAWVALTLVLYAGGVGLKSIANGTVPLALVGPSGYATIMGRLAMPSLMMQALAPVGAAELLAGGHGAADTLLWALAGAALLNLLLALALLRQRTRSR